MNMGRAGGQGQGEGGGGTRAVAGGSDWMPPPPPLPRLPPTVRAPDGPPIPEFMWCQRSDRVYLTIKVSE